MSDTIQNAENVMNITHMHVAKFGGTSLSDATHFSQIREISHSFPTPYCIVPSAPGKRFGDDIKVTDMLYSLCAEPLYWDSEKENTLQKISDRFTDIAEGLGIHFDIETYSHCIKEKIISGKCNKDFVASRGEYLCGMLLAKYLDCEFIDAADVILFNEYGILQIDATIKALRRRLKDVTRAVVPGFYGAERISGNIHTFSRGGSDITGAIVARAANALVYENWTDVSGFYVTDPRIVPDSKKVDSLGFGELRELSCMGASVLHGDTVLPLFGTGIPINVKNTNHPNDSGTMISQVSTDNKNDIAGIAGKKGYTTVLIKELALGDDDSFARRALHVFEAFSIPVEHMPLSMDNLSVIVYTKNLIGKKEALVRELHSVLGEISVDFCDGLSLIAVVSDSFFSSPDHAYTIFSALHKARIAVRMADHGSGSISFVVGIDEASFEDAVRAIYREFEVNGCI